MSKKYLVTEEFVKSDLKPGVIDRESGFLETSREELDPTGRWLTREQLEKIIRIRWLKERKSSTHLQLECDAIYTELMQTFDELFGPRDEK